MRKVIVILAAVLFVGCGGKQNTSTEGEASKEANTIICYWCKESIKAGAMACKHCGKHPAKPLIENEIVEQAIRKALGKPNSEGRLTETDLGKIGKLDLKYSNLSGVPPDLEKLPGLGELVLAGNNLTSVKGLENLTQLRDLDLFKNNLKDVKGLEKLKYLRELYLMKNPLSQDEINELKKALPDCKIYNDYDN